MTQPNTQLVIEIGDNNQINVHGPIGNKLLCYGLLEAAKDAIKDYNDKLTASPIVPATSGDVVAIRSRMQ